jgi:flagellar motor switch protein FliG
MTMREPIRGGASRCGSRGRASRRTLLIVLTLPTLATLVAGAPARAERRPPYGNDATLLEARVREEIEHRVTPVLEQMAPGQAELKYVDVRVNRPTALPAGAAPGFEELSPATEFVAEHAEVALALDSKLPPQFRKDLKNLIKNRLDSVAVPIDISETVLAFPTPRPQPAAPREPLYGYAPPPQPAQAQPPPAAAPATPPVPAPPPAPSGSGMLWVMGIALCIVGGLIGALIVLLTTIVAGRRAERAGLAGRRAQEGEAPAATRASRDPAPAPAPAADLLPEVRRALREDRVLARRVMSELLREGQLETVALTVEHVGPSVVEDLRADPTLAVPLREAAALLDRPRAQADARDLAAQLHRRILKQRMVGPEDPVEREFAFLLGLSPARLAAVLAEEPAAVQAAALRYAPAHLRAAYLDERSPAERTALAAALAGARALSQEHVLDVAATLRARAADHAHLDAGQAGDVDLAVELAEERSPAERAEILDAIRRTDPARARAVQASLLTDESFLRVSEDVLSAAAMTVPADALVRFLRMAPAPVAARTFEALPRPVAEGLQEDLSLNVAVSPQQAADARRVVFASLRKVLRERGLPAPAAPASAESDKGKVVAL